VIRTLSVWWDGVVVGSLQVNQHGQMRFTYASGWLADASRPAISFSLPKQEQPFTQRQCRPFFSGLLPEEAQRDVIAGALGISRGNDFAFLEALGGDVAGALSLWPEGEVPPAPDPTDTPRPLSDDELVDVLDTLPKRPLLAGREGMRLSLAGAQFQAARRAGRRPRGPTGARTADDTHSEAGHRALPAHHRERGVGVDAGRSGRTAGRAGDCP
jgi:serine/threonine-protein kinase HipA